MMAKLYAILGGIGAFILGFLRLKHVTKQRDEAIKQKERAAAWVERQEETREKDAEIDQEFSDAKREAKQELKDGEIPAHLKRPRRR